MNTDNIEIDQLINKAEEMMHSAYLNEHKLNYNNRRAEIVGIITANVQNEVGLSRRVNLGEKIADILGEDEVARFGNACNAETFSVHIDSTKIAWVVSTTKDGAQYKTPIILQAGDSGQAAIQWIYVSIVAEAFSCLLAAVGLAVNIAPESMNSIHEEIIPVVESTTLRRALDDLHAHWTDNHLDQARAIVTFILATHAGGIFWTIIKCLLSNMGYTDYLRAIGTIAANIVVTTSTGGGAFVARLVLGMQRAVRFGQKISNLRMLHTREKALVTR